MGQNLDELFDVVDDQDRVTGQMARREVHRLKLRHRAVHLLVCNRAGQVFLHQRSRQKDLFPGYWDSSAAGHVGAGEDYDGTAVRELEEELGCRPAQPPQPLFKIESREETGQEFVWVYRVEDEGPFSPMRSSEGIGLPRPRSIAGSRSVRTKSPRRYCISGRWRGITCGDAVMS
jgi:8-oxo-dGTP pyrophosphatase MutT (NUDIX family)